MLLDEVFSVFSELEGEEREEEEINVGGLGEGDEEGEREEDGVGDGVRREDEGEEREEGGGKIGGGHNGHLITDHATPSWKYMYSVGVVSAGHLIFGIQNEQYA